MCLWTQADTPIEKAWLVCQQWHTRHIYSLAVNHAAEVCGLRTRCIRKQLLDPRTDSKWIFLRTLRTRTDTDHNFSAWILWTSLMKLMLCGVFRGGQCLITVQLQYSACISIFIQRSRCCDTMNSVKILHAVRSAITAIAELLVKIHCHTL